ncbi:hypothetical protein [Microvirga calopogonii]|uniref:hypothetical protein n=1 Tax=Microvirga calopogonii TaxID=2078013 RepID=UPI000E0DB472|nr:hypothetical protein [Microvirga calopogonii]
MIAACGFISAFGLTEPALADPFTRAPGDYGTIVNNVLTRAGTELRLDLKRCEDAPSIRCRFSSGYVDILVEGRDQSREMQIERIIIAADILKNHPAVQPHVIVTDAFIALTATMMVFDPDLPPDRRSAMVSRLVTAVHASGHGEDSGIAADYVVDLHQGVSTWLVMNVTPKSAP